MRIAVVVVTVLAVAGPARAGSGFLVIPPVEVDVGIGAPVGADVDRIAPSTEILAGIHWASLAWKPTRFDVGIGYVGSFRTIASAERFGDEELRMHGGYLQLATTIASGRHWRTWVAARGELLRVSHDHRELAALGSALRISTELFGAGSTGDRNVAVIGTIALGVYVEATYRDVPGELGPLGLTSGVTCRLPFLVGS